MIEMYHLFYFIWNSILLLIRLHNKEKKLYREYKKCTRSIKMKKKRKGSLDEIKSNIKKRDATISILCSNYYIIPT